MRTGMYYGKNRDCGRNDKLWERTELTERQGLWEKQGLWVTPYFKSKNRIVETTKDHWGLG
jgi:hypothetical protein